MTLYGLQYLRAVAALAVVYSHATIQVPAYQAILAHAGSFGVDIFFVISGFIMVYIARPHDTPARFMLARVRRVVPLYWFFTLLLAAILLLLPAVFKRSVFDIHTLWQSLFFVPHFSHTDPAMIWPLLAPGWSLNYEMYFYLAFALSLTVAARWRVALITLAISLVFLLTRASGSQTAAVLFYGDPIVFEFVIGMLLAVAYRRGLHLQRRTALLCVLAGATWLLLPLADSLSRLLHFGVGATLVVQGVLYLALPYRRIGVLLGDASYALYLSHLFVLGVLRKLLPPILGDGLPGAVGFVILSLLICTLASIVVHAWIDNRLLHLPTWRRWRQGRVPPQGS